MSTIQKLKAEKMGFITGAELPGVIAEDRFAPCLVRCGGGRFVCAADQVEHFMEAVKASGDYVRDVSLVFSYPGAINDLTGICLQWVAAVDRATKADVERALIPMEEKVDDPSLPFSVRMLSNFMAANLRAQLQRF